MPKIKAASNDDADFSPITISGWADASKHINALWKAHNEQCKSTGDKGLMCSDPLGTCGSFWKKPPTKKAAKKR